VCILDATIDNMRTSRALRLVQDSRPDLKRYTVGVLAKIDKSFMPDWEDEGQESGYWKVKARMEGTSADYVPLDFGYVPVKNRNTKSRVAQHSIREHKLQEEQWFAEQMPGASDVGIVSVIQRLDRLFHKFLGEDYVPKKREELNTRKATCMKQLELLGADPATLPMPDVQTHFNQAISNTLKQGAADTICNVICEGFRADLPDFDTPFDNRFARVAATKTLRNHFISVLQHDKVVDLAEENMKMSVRHVFESDTEGRICLCRFGKLRGEVEHGVADHIRSQSEKFVTDAVATLLNLCSASRGGEPIAVDRVCEAMADCAVEHFLLPCSEDFFPSSEMPKSQQFLTEDCANERAEYLEELVQIDLGLAALDRIKDL